MAVGSEHARGTAVLEYLRSTVQFKKLIVLKLTILKIIHFQRICPAADPRPQARFGS